MLTWAEQTMLCLCLLRRFSITYIHLYIQTSINVSYRVWMSISIPKANNIRTIIFDQLKEETMARETFVSIIYIIRSTYLNTHTHRYCWHFRHLFYIEFVYIYYCRFFFIFRQFTNEVTMMKAVKIVHTNNKFSISHTHT